MGLELISGPASEPVTLDEAKAHLRVDHDDEDALILRLIRAGREFAEGFTGRAIIAQSWKLWCDGWPGGASPALVLPKPPLVAVTSITAYDRSGAASPLSSDDYIVDSARQPGRVVLKGTAALPAGLREANAIAVAFDAGYGATALEVPSAIRNAILAHVAHSYEARGDGADASPRAALSLLAPFRVIGL